MPLGWSLGLRSCDDRDLHYSFFLVRSQKDAWRAVPACSRSRVTRCLIALAVVRLQRGAPVRHLAVPMPRAHPRGTLSRPGSYLRIGRSSIQDPTLVGSSLRLPATSPPPVPDDPAGLSQACPRDQSRPRATSAAGYLAGFFFLPAGGRAANAMPAADRGSSSSFSHLGPTRGDILGGLVGRE